MDKEKGKRIEPWQDRLEHKVDHLEEELNHLRSDVQGLKVGQQTLEAYFEFLRESLDRYQTENKRYFEVLIEHHRSEKAILGEGTKANSERLDDHELRIQALEAG